MPIYEYECQQCHHRFEELQRVNDPAPEQCPECTAPQPTRLVSSAGFQLKGSGWYVTDFKDKPKQTEKKTTETKSPETKKTETKKQDT